jgi:hypothetical protein
MRRADHIPSIGNDTYFDRKNLNGKTAYDKGAYKRTVIEITLKN